VTGLLSGGVFGVGWRIDIVRVPFMVAADNR